MPVVIIICYEINLMLLNPIETWFAPNFLMVDRLFELKPTIEQIVIDINWVTLSTFCVVIINRSCSPKQELFEPT